MTTQTPRDPNPHPEQHYAHPLFTHPDGQQCIWPDDSGWFVPYDVGGEGADCRQWHPGDDERRTLSALNRALVENGGAEPANPDAQEATASALRAARTGGAGHWPTVAALLADEVIRLRAALGAIAPSPNDPTTPNATER